MTNKMLKFFRGATMPSVADQNASIGSIWFDTAKNVIKVRTAENGIDADWEVYGTSPADLTAAISRIATLEGAVKTLNETTLPALRTELEQAIAAAVAAESTIARKAEQDLGKRIDDLAAASVSVAEKTNGHVTVSKATNDTTGAVVYTIAESDIASAQALAAEVKRAGEEDARIVGLVEAEAARAAGEETRIAGLVNTEKGRAEGVEAGLQSAIDTLNGADTVSGSVAKAVKDAKDSLIGGAQTLTDFAKVETAIANAESAAKAAASVVEEGTDAGNNLSIVTTTDDKTGAITYTVNLSDVASATKVATLIGEDDNKSVRAIANEELAKQLIAEGADAALDTLQEIAQWIQDHPEDAAEMNDKIAQLQKDVDAIEADYLTSTDKTELTGAIATAKGEAIDAAASNAAAAISEAIGKLDAEVTSADGSKVTVKVTETDGVITAVNVTESDIASAKDLSDLAKVVEDNEHTTAAAVNELNERINNLPTEVGVMSVDKGTDGNFVTTTIAGDAAHPVISVAVDYIDGTETGTKLTTDTYVGEAIAAAVAAKNVAAEGDDLVSATAANNKVTVAATQDLKDAVAAANSAVQTVKSDNNTLQVTQTGTTVNVELAWQLF